MLMMGYVAGVDTATDTATDIDLLLLLLLLLLLVVRMRMASDNNCGQRRCCFVPIGTTTIDATVALQGRGHVALFRTWCVYVWQGGRVSRCQGGGLYYTTRLIATKKYSMYRSDHF